MNKLFKSIYEPGEKLCIDESMVKFKGIYSAKTYCPLKPFKQGLKIYVLAESQTGFVCSMKPFLGKGSSLIDTIKYLVEDYKNLNRKVYMDNYYNSYQNTIILRNLGIYVCGTIRLNRLDDNLFKDYKKSLKKNHMVCRQRNQVNVIVWHDKKICSLISSFHNIELPDSRNPIIVHNKINMIRDYDRNMGGVDIMDQLVFNYFSEHRHSHWTHKLAIYIINLLVHNAYVLYRKKHIGQATSLKHLEFIKQAITFFRGSISNTNNNNVSNLHLIRTYDNRLRRLCSSCVHQPAKKTRHYCNTCSRPLCSDQCFYEYHDKKDS